MAHVQEAQRVSSFEGESDTGRPVQSVVRSSHLLERRRPAGPAQMIVHAGYRPARRRVLNDNANGPCTCAGRPHVLAVFITVKIGEVEEPHYLRIWTDGTGARTRAEFVHVNIPGCLSDPTHDDTRNMLE